MTELEGDPKDLKVSDWIRKISASDNFYRGMYREVMKTDINANLSGQASLLKGTLI